MSIAADDQPRPFPKKRSRAAMGWKKATALLPRWYSKQCFDFQACDWFELELLLLIDLIC
jgi:hypothetical protein